VVDRHHLAQSAVHTHLLPTGKVLFTSEFQFGVASGEALVLAGETNGPGANNPLPKSGSQRRGRGESNDRTEVHPYYPRTIVGPDDGAAVWINGALVFSKNTGRGLDYARYASASTRTSWPQLDIPPTSFVAGENVVAVMVKQSARPRRTCRSRCSST